MSVRAYRHNESATCRTIRIFILSVAVIAFPICPAAVICADEEQGSNSERIFVFGLKNPNFEADAADDPPAGDESVSVTQQSTSEKEDEAAAPNRYRILAFPVDGSAVKTIAEIPNHAWRARVSPNGKQIVFNMPANAVSTLEDDDGWMSTKGWDIWLMNADGTNRRRIIKDAGPGEVTCWSPDGTQFVYFREHHFNSLNKRYRNYVFDITRQQKRQLDFPENEMVWDWSPNGKEWLTCTENEDTPPGQQIFRVNHDGSDRVRLGRPNKNNLCPRFSPDSKRITFLSYNQRGANVCLINPDGSSLFEITHDDLIRPGRACWSPDGRQLATLCHYGWSEQYADKAVTNLFVFNADGTNVRRITPNGLIQETSMGIAWR